MNFYSNKLFADKENQQQLANRGLCPWFLFDFFIIKILLSSQNIYKKGRCILKYKTKKAGKRIIFVPDEELRQTLKMKLRGLQKFGPFVRSETTTFGKKNGLRILLSRHSGHRFFIIVDFVHAFHQITRKMISDVLPEITGSRFDACFVELGGKQVIPIGFPTSNYIFEIFASRRFDTRLVFWQNKYNGCTTRNGDNVLITWQKNTEEAFKALEEIFDGFEVRLTPQKPRKWQEPIRFCGITIPKKNRPHLSNRKRKKLLVKARQKSHESLTGATQFICNWSQ